MNYTIYPGLPVKTKKSHQIGTFYRIIQFVCDEYGITEENLKDKYRGRHFVVPRQVAMYLLNYYTQYTLKYIGMWFNRDHTTVMHSCVTVRDLMQTDQEYKERVDFLMLKISGSL